MKIMRQYYFDQLIDYKDKPIIKVVTGVRRCGKSTLLLLFKQYLMRQGVREDQIIFINFEDYDVEALYDPRALHAYIKQRLKNDAMTYILLDEVQNVADFQRVVDSLYIRPNVDIYMTGSNSRLLSGELATLLSGRYVQIEMLPFSFMEFLQLSGGGQSPEAAYRQYVENGSFPFVQQLQGNDRQVQDYLRSLYNTIIVKDVIARRKIDDVMMLESVLRFAADNIGNTLSTHKISSTMTSSGRSINVRTVESYLSALMESYILYQVKRFDIKGKEYLKTLEKYYMVDIGLRRAMLGSSAQADTGHILENIVFLELKRRGYEIFIGKVDQWEVDFVARSYKKTVYIQVAATVREQATLERELRPLQKISDHFPKYLLTLDMDSSADYDGIMKINALDFLLGKNEL